MRGRVDVDQLIQNQTVTFEANVFAQRQAEGELIPPPSILAVGYGDENTSLPLKDRQRARAENERQIREAAEKFGEPIRNYAGKVQGYNLPAEWSQPAAPGPKPSGRQSASVTPIASSFPDDERPTRREFESWGPTQAREWLEARGFWGGEIPDSAFRRD